MSVDTHALGLGARTSADILSGATSTSGPTGYYTPQQRSAPILSRKHSVLIADLYFGEKPEKVRGADIVRYNEWSTPPPGLRIPPTHTAVLDLTRPEAELLEGMGRATRYELRRACQDSLDVKSFHGGETGREIVAFADYYDRHAALKNLASIDRARLQQFARSGVLELTRVDCGGAALVWHAYYRDATHALLLYSQSSQRASTVPSYHQLVGRANRYLHWRDIVRFREQGVAVLDFGGWYSGSEDRALLQINRFKANFGVRVIEVFTSLEPLSFKGRMAVWWVAKKAGTPGVVRHKY